MDEAQQIDHLITVMQQLQDMSKELDNPDRSNSMIMGLMIAMIISTPIPDIKIIHEQTNHTHIGLA